MIAILRYNAGNATSVFHAVKALGYEVCITDDPEQLYTSDKVIIPGVGAAASAMNYLCNTGLDQVILDLRQPVLGICLGQQLLCSHSEEGEVDCLGIFNTRVRRFPPLERVPHMGWNNIQHDAKGLFDQVPCDSDVYFVHSYYCVPNAQTIATCNYILPFAAAMQQDNFYATQFHPEKSSGTGRQILDNFLKIKTR